MKKKFLWIWFFACLFLINGCRKKSDIRFNGKIIKELNGEPLIGAEIMLVQDYEKGSPRSPNSYGPYYTNSNGIYDFVNEITHYENENFRYFVYNKEPGGFEYVFSASTDESFQTIVFPARGVIDFHIVNQNPYNSNDLLKSIDYAIDTNQVISTFGVYKTGANINEHFYRFLLGHNKTYYYRYNNVKNGISYTSAYSALICIGSDTVSVGINY